MAETDPWADLADDIRRTVRTAETAEAWQARAEKAEARVAELEAAVEDAIGQLLVGTPQLALGGLRAALARPAGEPDHA